MTVVADSNLLASHFTFVPRVAAKNMKNVKGSLESQCYISLFWATVYSYLIAPNVKMNGIIGQVQIRLNYYQAAKSL